MQYDDAVALITEKETEQSMFHDEIIQMPEETAVPTYAEMSDGENCLDIKILNNMRDKAETRKEMHWRVKESYIVTDERMQEISQLLAVRAKDNASVEPDCEPMMMLLIMMMMMVLMMTMVVMMVMITFMIMFMMTTMTTMAMMTVMKMMMILNMTMMILMMTMMMIVVK